MLKSSLTILFALIFLNKVPAQCNYSASNLDERIISPSDFGAKPNDTIADNYAFQCALDSAAVDTSLILYIEPGLYYFEGTVFLSSNLVLDGHFKQTTIKPTVNYKHKGPLFSLHNNLRRLENVLVTGIIFDADSSTTPIWGYKNMQIPLQDFTVSNCEFLNLNANVFFTSDHAKRTKLLNNKFDNFNEGIDTAYIYGSVHCLSCTDCEIDGNEFSGMGFVGNGAFENHRLTNNYFHDIGETSIFYRITDTAKNLLITGNNFENIKKIDGCKGCMVIEGFKQDTSFLYHLTVNNNTFRDVCNSLTAGGGDEEKEELYIEGLSYQNNIVYGSNYDFKEGDGDDINGGVALIIRAGDTEPVVNDVIISGNTIVNFRTPGIRIGAADFLIADNLIEHTGIQDTLSSGQMPFHSGILIYKNATRGVVQGNLIKNIGPSNLDETSYNRITAGIAIYNSSASEITIRHNTIIDTRHSKNKNPTDPSGFTSYGIDANYDGTTAGENILIEGNLIKNMHILPVIGAGGIKNSTNRYLKNITDREFREVTSSFKLNYYEANVGFAYAGLFSKLPISPTGIKITATLPHGYEGYTFGPFITNTKQAFELRLSSSDQFLTGFSRATLQPNTLTYAKCISNGLWKLIKE